MFIRHPLEDYVRWRRGYDDFDQERKGKGVSGDAVYQSVDDPTTSPSGTTSRRLKPGKSSLPRRA
jgi:hypothetical protein